MNKETVDDLKTAADKFDTISGFKDSDALRQQCLDKIREIEENREKERLRAIEAKRIATKKRRIKRIVALVSVVLIVSVTVLTNKVIKYNKAVQLVENGDYCEALDIIGGKKFTNLLTDKGYTDKLAEFQNDLSNFAGTYKPSSLYDYDLIIEVDAVNWNYAIYEKWSYISELYEVGRYDYSFAIGEDVNYNGYSDCCLEGDRKRIHDDNGNTWTKTNE